MSEGVALIGTLKKQPTYIERGGNVACAGPALVTGLMTNPPATQRRTASS